LKFVTNMSLKLKILLCAPLTYSVALNFRHGKATPPTPLKRLGDLAKCHKTL